MANEAAKAIERVRLVTLPICGKTVEVRRWSFIRSGEISRFMNDVIAGLPPDVSLDVGNSMSVFYQTSPKKMLEVARLSVAPEYRPLVDEEIDAADAFAILDAAFEINQEGDGLGKMQGLATNMVMGRAIGEAQKITEPPKPPLK